MICVCSVYICVVAGCSRYPKCVHYHHGWGCWIFVRAASMNVTCCSYLGGVDCWFFSSSQTALMLLLLFLFVVAINIVVLVVRLCYDGSLLEVAVSFILECSEASRSSVLCWYSWIALSWTSFFATIELLWQRGLRQGNMLQISSRRKYRLELFVCPNFWRWWNQHREGEMHYYSY